MFISKLYKIDERRLVGLVMIPGKHLVKIETEDLDVSSSMYT
jgi:hypothetical protein